MNKYKSHVFVIPEDRSDAQIANGFVQYSGIRARQIQVLAEAGGWPKVLALFKEEYVSHLEKYPEAYAVMLIDFDGKPDERRAKFVAAIPDDLKSRVFILGPRDTPEKLRQSLGKKYEDIGNALATECDGGLNGVWSHEQWEHNSEEQSRLVDSVKPFLFS